jgi:hypothetical protein
MFLPIPLTKPRKWMNIRIKAVERRWFDDFGQFCTYALKNAVIDEIIDEDDLVWRIAKSLRDEEIHPDDVDGIEEHIMEVYGIAEEYLDLIMQKVRNEMRLLEAELEEVDEIEDEAKIERKIDHETYRQILGEVQRMYLEEDYDRQTIIKAIMLQYGLDEWEAREIVSAAESIIFS